jgi:carboxymethylenebutenolidase
MEAEYLVAIAANDDERDPQSKNTLRSAFDTAGKSAVVEVFEGTMHGWCPTDSSVYHHDQAEHAWSHMLTIFARALA